VNSIRSLLAATKITFSGLVIAQAVSLLGSLVIAGIFMPSEFGLFATWIGITSIASIVLSWRLELSLVTVPNGKERLRSLRLVLATIICSTLLLSILTSLAWVFIGLIQNQTKLSIIMFILVACLTSMIQAWLSWVVANGDYKSVSLSRILQALMVTSTQILIGLISPSADSLMLGHAFGLIVTLLISLKIKPITQINLWHNLSIFHQLVKFWTSNKRFIVYSLPADLLSVATSYLPLFFIVYYYGPVEGGLFALVMRIMGGPIGLAGTAVLDVFKRNASVAVREVGNCRHVYLTTFKLLFGMSLLMILIVAPFSESFFEMAYGETWRNAGIVALWLLPLFVAKFIASPLSYVFYIVGAQRIDLIWQSTLFLITLTIFFMTSSFEHAVQAYSIGYVLMYTLYATISYRLSLGYVR
jgi:O-antigen/teichoic acid export membrane protein